MLVYRSVESVDDAGRMLDTLRDAVRSAARADAGHEAFVDALLSSAELETSVLDAWFDSADDIAPAERAHRTVTELSAGRVAASWRQVGERHRDAPELLGAVHALARLTSSRVVRAKVPEGFAYYAVYPELYGDAAARFARERQPEFVTVIGIRTIGTALSAIVVAALRACGVSAVSCTVRPRGHPFDRHVAVTPRMRAWLRDRARGWFAIVDEGPGLSGSSFAAVSRVLSELGVPADRIVLFPSWVPEAETLRNTDAQIRWRAHEKFVECFERAFLQSGRLAGAWNATIESDWSAGRWREALYRDGASPVVQPQHEQRKYVCRTATGERLLLKFIGLGQYGRARRDLARHLAGAQLAACPRGTRYGFLATDFVDGAPAGSTPTRAELTAIAAYVAHRGTCTPATRDSATLDDLLNATRVNVRESLGENLAERACRIVRALEFGPVSATVDGRMQQHEWIRSGTRLVKTDGVAHHDDHFLQPPGDPVWDLAGASVEWQFDAAQDEYLVREYVAQSGDASAADRFEPCRVAYLAHRIGYATLAAETLGDSQDGRGMRALADRYATQLRSRLEVE